ncbi:valine--tRNA ligase [Pendulispora albinea]|uniref:Valine--tRNA ligase n=1 Tax=Pendulispora albinea TaxID=2741071 RepID=A0ABZ2LUK4_9BACT
MSAEQNAPDLSKGYDPAEVEQRWYSFWEKHGVFEAADDPADPRPVYVIPMPPPNVTGSLHMGHAQRCTLEDALIRWHRMRGFNTLWQPGMDHAGIATQTVVERQLLREKKTRHELGREAFEQRIWQWKAESGGRIAVQQRELGASPDWRRSKFTMDADMARAVREAFVRLHEEGLMYRATRLINWCPECMTALSDLEVETEEGAQGELFQFAYRVEGENEEIVVATTRPETMLGDTAVAVHPADPRYTHLHGKRLEHPFLLRTVPVITDEILVDPKFGTGAVKVTPAHDFNDFATGKRHRLEEINIFNLDGTLNDKTGDFAGMTRKKARAAVKQALEDKGLARGSKPHVLALPKCQRSGGVVEPMISTQWFLKMGQMAKEALEAVHGTETSPPKTEIIPAEWVKTYDHFLENIQDWCVSRQLWWGHQIPAWHGPNGQIRVARERPPECTPEAGWTQDPDVLDTWFSSALWPFSTLGWPDETPALKKFYPAGDLETGYDILFFWVARMMMFGLHFMKEVPFRRVLLSGLIVDETGEKMSKVKGNVIDPLDLIHGADFAEVVSKTLPGAPEQEALTKFKKAYPSAAQMGKGFPPFGADALRFTLATFPPTNRRIALALKRLEGYRFFVNKVWNATRFSLENLRDLTRAGGALPEGTPEPKGFYNRYILSRLGQAARIANRGIGSFRVDEAANELYRFFWNDFCDWYVELTKIVFQSSAETASEEEQEETRHTLAHVLESSLRLLHPLMPFVTEELWQRVPKPSSRPVSVALAPYPTEDDGRIDLAVEREMELVQAIIGAARTVRSEHEIKPAERVPVWLRVTDLASQGERIARHLPAIRTLVKTADDPKVIGPTDGREAGTVVTVVPSDLGAVEVLVGLRGLVPREKELARIDREIKRVDRELAAIDKKLQSKGFVDRAPKEVVDEAHGQRKALSEARERILASRTLADELEAES